MLAFAAAGAGVLVATALLAQSPLLRIRAVSWTGPLLLSEERCRALERAALGHPLYLISERVLHDALALDGLQVRVELRRHPPGMLEARVEPRLAVARLDDRTPVDAHGRRLPPEHLVPGLPLLSGFTLDAKGQRLSPAMRQLLATLGPLFECPTLAPSEIRLADGEVRLVLFDSGTQVRLGAATAGRDVLKLRIFEESLRGEPLPAAVDLRFADQVVVREGGSGGSRRGR